MKETVEWRAYRRMAFTYEGHQLRRPRSRPRQALPCPVWQSPAGVDVKRAACCGVRRPVAQPSQPSQGSGGGEVPNAVVRNSFLEVSPRNRDRNLRWEMGV